MIYACFKHFYQYSEPVAALTQKSTPLATCWPVFARQVVDDSSQFLHIGYKLPNLELQRLGIYKRILVQINIALNRLFIIILGKFHNRSLATRSLLHLSSAHNTFFQKSSCFIKIIRSRSFFVKS